VPGTDAHQRAEAEKAITVLLTDPTAAQFRSVAVEPSTGAVCGEVNARTMFGGYSGFHRFIRNESRHSAIVEGLQGSTEMFAVNWQSDCPTSHVKPNGV